MTEFNLKKTSVVPFSLLTKAPLPACDKNQLTFHLSVSRVRLLPYQRHHLRHQRHQRHRHRHLSQLWMLLGSDMTSQCPAVALPTLTLQGDGSRTSLVRVLLWSSWLHL